MLYYTYTFDAAIFLKNNIKIVYNYIIMYIHLYKYLSQYFVNK